MSLEDVKVAPWNKGLGVLETGLDMEAIADKGWRLLDEDLSLPAAVLLEDRIAHNLAWMQEFVRAYGAQLAPHGKTTMAPKLFARQIAGGAWGITLATTQQVRAAYEHGVKRILLANQLVGKQSMRTIAHLLRDPEFEFYCLVDSAENVRQVGSFFADAGLRLQVLLEAGAAGGRTGVRSPGQRDSVLDALASHADSIALCGVELFEGILDNAAAVQAFLDWAVELARTCANRGLLRRSPAVLTGAGSAWYDLVAKTFARADIGVPVEVILRPGCYLTHDAGVYREAQRRILASNPIARRMHSGLLPALQLWAYVHSVPEARRAVVGLGKRDAAFDAGYPQAIAHYRPGSAAPMAAPHSWTITKMMDQHAFLEIGEGDDILPGDMLAFDISHPCLTFDKWRYLFVVDSDWKVVEVLETFF